MNNILLIIFSAMIEVFPQIIVARVRELAEQIIAGIILHMIHITTR